MCKRCELFLCFIIGGTLYPALEILWRGYSHFSMTIVGGACFCFIYFIHTKYNHLSVFVRAFLCCGIITTLEFFSGVVLNLLLRLDVWDYSKEIFNLYGQICLSYCLVWYFLSLLCAPLCLFLRKIWVRKV
jgi:uncharacterized membrane protein